MPYETALVRVRLLQGTGHEASSCASYLTSPAPTKIEDLCLNNSGSPFWSDGAQWPPGQVFNPSTQRCLSRQYPDSHANAFAAPRYERCATFGIR